MSPPTIDEALQARRTALLVLLHELTETAPLLAPEDEQLMTGLAAAARQASAALSPLAVLGLEGAGKSSFVNALIGDVVPLEAHKPGTVAPTVIRWGPTEVPGYGVLHIGSEDWTTCDDIEQFRRFMLQRHNKDNAQQVQAGLVEVAQSVLAAGLVLIDTPGLNSRAADVQKVTDSAVADARRAVIVMRNRQAGRTFAEISRRGLADVVDAVVLNADLDLWLDDETEVERSVTEARSEIVEIAREANIELDPGSVQVVHLPSLDQGALPTGGPSAIGLHRAEVARLQEWLRNVVAEERAETQLDAAAATLRFAAEPLRRRFEQFVESLRILNGSPLELRTYDSRMKQIQAWRTVKLARWEKYARSDARRALEDSHWKQVDSLAQAARRVLRAAALEMQHIGDGLPSPRGSTVMELQSAHEASFLAAAKKAQEAHETAVLALVADLRVTAGRLTADPPAAVPIPSIGSLGNIRVRGGSVADVALPDDVPANLLEVFSDARAARRLAASYREQADRCELADRRAFTECTDAAIDAFRDAIDAGVETRISFLRRPDKTVVRDWLEAYQDALAVLNAPG